MMTAVSDQQQWARKTVAGIGQVAEPFRSNLLRWLEDATGCNRSTANVEARLAHLEQHLANWLSSLQVNEATQTQQYIDALVCVSTDCFGITLDELLPACPLPP